MARYDLATVAAEAAICTRCQLASGRTQVVFGGGNPKADLMFIGEGPGRDEDLQGEPFVGRSGKLLDRLILEELGHDRSGAYICNVVKCRPPENRDPLPDEIESCRPWLESQLELVDPKVIVTLGNYATRRILETKEGITKMRGQEHAWNGRVVVPTFHPSAALRSGGGQVLAEMRADLVRAKLAVRRLTGERVPAKTELAGSR
ncbi:MAG TPA: uracil-DNA glycosylase [Acidimicrobiales bacterium]|nr:uracil-DNA glycosylase [Acidimicrobiales bacterium]